MDLCTPLGGKTVKVRTMELILKYREYCRACRREPLLGHEKESGSLAVFSMLTDSSGFGYNVVFPSLSQHAGSVCVHPKGRKELCVFV